MKKDEAKLVLEALTESVDLVEHAYITDWRHGIPTRAKQLAGMRDGVELHKQAIAIMRREEDWPEISDAEIWKQAVMLAYGHLWHVNNEPMAPIPMRSPEKAAYAARKVLLDLLTHEERGLAINEVRALLEKAR